MRIWDLVETRYLQTDGKEAKEDGTSYREQLGDNRPYWKVIVSLAFSLAGTILFVWIGWNFWCILCPL